MLAFLLASMALTFSPGPDILYVIAQSISNGKKYGIAVALGLVSGILVHTSFVALGISAAIRQSEYLFLGIKICGATYLLWLAYQVWKAPAGVAIAGTRQPRKGSWALFRQGFLMNVLNPKVTLFFLAFLPGFIDESRGEVVQQIYTLGLVFMLQALAIFVFVSWIADRLTVELRTNDRFAVFLKWLQIVVFITIAVMILT
jgi:threonine/homoserine/homoserine lactone efflux protein